MQTMLVAPAAALPMAARAQAPAADTSPGTSLAAATMGLISSTVCRVLPATTEGPYYVDPHLVRRDITEKRPGIPLRLNLQVVNAACQPLRNARVDVWHCDAQGDYSAFAAPGPDARPVTEKTFLRGTQMTDDHGIVTFETIYPGWYRGRTTHIHYKVFLNQKTVLTSQIFLPDALNEYLYLKAPAYLRQEERDTVNSIDGIARQAGEGACCAIREQDDRYIASLVVGVDPAATWSEQGQGMGGPGGPGGPPPPGMGGNGRPMGPPSGGRPGGPPPGGPGGPGGPPPSQRTARTRLFPGG